jgi:hypothetical protein
VKAENAAALAAARAAWNLTPTQVHPAGGVPASPPTPYLVLSVTSGAPGNYRARSHGSKKHYIVVQAVGKTIDEVAFAVDKADAAFEDKALTVAGFDCTESNGEDRTASTVIRDPDAGGLLTCTVLYPFYAYPTT